MRGKREIEEDTIKHLRRESQFIKTINQKKKEEWKIPIHVLDL